MYVLSVNLLNSRTGRAMMAIRDNQIAASSMGVNLALYKTLAFGISAGMTGVAGGLGAIVVAFVAPDGYSITFANQLFLGMVIGGVGWLPGSLAGGAFIVLVPNMAESISKGLSGAVFGVFIIIVIFAFPNGARQAAYSRGVLDQAADGRRQVAAGPILQKIQIPHVKTPQEKQPDCRRPSQRTEGGTAKERSQQKRRGDTMKAMLKSVASCDTLGSRARPCPDRWQRARTEEIRYRRDRHRNQDRSHHRL